MNIKNLWVATNQLHLVDASKNAVRSWNFDFTRFIPIVKLPLKVNSGPPSCMTSGGPKDWHHKRHQNFKKSHGHRVIALVTWLVFVLFSFRKWGLTSFQGSTHLPCHETSLYIAVCKSCEPQTLESWKVVTTGFSVQKYYLLVWAPGSLQKNSTKIWRFYQGPWNGTLTPVLED